jgi:hypothetical protein
MQVEGQQDISVLLATGERVRNTYAIYLVLGHSFRKRKLIPYIISITHVIEMKAPAVQDEHASH